VRGDRTLLRAGAVLWALAVPVLALELPWPFPAFFGVMSVVLWRLSRKPRPGPLKPLDPLPWRLPVTPGELAALNGEADLQAQFDATPLRHMEAL